MTKNEQSRLVAWRLKLLRQASDLPRGVAQTCRHFGLSRQAFYKWRARYLAERNAPRSDLQDPVSARTLSLRITALSSNLSFTGTSRNMTSAMFISALGRLT